MEALSEVATEAQRVVTTIEKMKTLMRSVQTQHRAIDLGAVVRSALLYNKTMLARHKVGVRESGLEEVHSIMGDDAQLQLAITNILRNAAEAIDDSAAQQREISIDLAVKNNEVVLTIGDSGPGWSGAESAETPLTTTKKGGTGIGLYVARTAMENHRGKISFGKSSLGGAEVKMIFPQAG
jgi:nitrogen fixation/metabolism regulation signal transduction histidine kinase